MKILALGAHPDDIEIFMYGLISIYQKKGNQIYTMIATDGAKGGSLAKDKLVSKRVTEAILGLKKLSEPIFSHRIFSAIAYKSFEILPLGSYNFSVFLSLNLSFNDSESAMALI